MSFYTCQVDMLVCPVDNSALEKLYIQWTPVDLPFVDTQKTVPELHNVYSVVDLIHPD